MAEEIPITQKLGCEKNALDSCLLVKASVEAISTFVKQYFELEIKSNCKLIEYLDANKTSWEEIERQRLVRNSRPNKSLPPIIWSIPLWRYFNHQWTIMPFSGTEDSIAFVLSLLLNTDAITFYDSDNASVSEFKVFRNDKLVEHYLFGLECGMQQEEYSDIVVDFELFEDFLGFENHYFKSSVRQVTKSQIRSALSTRKHDGDNKGFLDACLKYHKAYIPLLKETPYHYHGEWNSDFQMWDSMVERMDLIIVSSNWRYIDWKVPGRVI